LVSFIKDDCNQSNISYKQPLWPLLWSCLPTATLALLSWQ
jgi:hypothetical protein